jgi:tRNA U34 5-methylaminomethyl-2-thiouridine-forming methyltransferase MnmC
MKGKLAILKFQSILEAETDVHQNSSMKEQKFQFVLTFCIINAPISNVTKKIIS